MEFEVDEVNGLAVQPAQDVEVVARPDGFVGEVGACGRLRGFSRLISIAHRFNCSIDVVEYAQSKLSRHILTGEHNRDYKHDLF